MKRFTVDADRQLAQRGGILRNGILLLAEEIVAGALGMKRRVIEERAHFRVAAFTAQDIELFFRAGEITGEAKKLEEKCAALRISGIVPHLGVQGLNGVVEAPRLKQLLDRHETPDSITVPGKLGT